MHGVGKKVRMGSGDSVHVLMASFLEYINELADLVRGRCLDQTIVYQPYISISFTYPTRCCTFSKKVKVNLFPKTT